MLCNTCDEGDINELTWCVRFRRCKNDDFNVEDPNCGAREKAFEQTELEVLLNEVSVNVKIIGEIFGSYTKGCFRTSQSYGHDSINKEIKSHRAEIKKC